MATRLRGWMPRFLAVAAVSATSSISVTSFALSSPDSPLHSTAVTLFQASPDGRLASIVAAHQGFLRSSRAIYTFAVNAYDYKYSLRGYEEKSAEYYSVRSEVHARASQRLLQLCEANRGFYIKAGQFVASMHNIPKEYVSTLSVLQDQARSWPFSAIQHVVLGEFGRDVEHIFSEFDEQPVAAASLAQVHHAVLKNGQEVAVKVQYPHLQQQFQTDVRTMMFLSEAVTWLFPDYQFGWIVPEFEKSLSRELDFVLEGQNAEQTAKNFARKDNVKIPHINWDLTTSRVLTMEFIGGGCKVDDVQSLKEAGINQLQFFVCLSRALPHENQSGILSGIPNEVAELLVEVFAEMVFCHGFVHGDPHPGNILVRPRTSGRGKRNFDLVLLDHGLYRELDEGFRSDFCRLWKALILLDPNEMEEVGDRLGAGQYYRFLPVIFTGRAIGSKSGLGQGMTSEEKVQLKAEVQHFTMGDISDFMEGLPRDVLTVLRTDGLLRSITSRLGATPRMRLIANAKYAVMGLALDHRGGPGKESQGWQAHTKAVYEYAQLRVRLELLEFSYRFGLFYGSLLQRVKNIVMRTLAKFGQLNLKMRRSNVYS